MMISGIRHPVMQASASIPRGPLGHRAQEDLDHFFFTLSLMTRDGSSDAGVRGQGPR